MRKENVPSWPTDRTIVLYCAKGEGQRMADLEDKSGLNYESHQCAETFYESGIKNRYD